MTTTSKGKEFWAERVAALRASGQSSAAFARETGLSVHALGWWRRKLSAPGTSVSGRAAAKPPAKANEVIGSKGSKFVALKVADPMTNRSVGVTVSIGSELRLSMSELPPAAWLAEVGQALRGLR